MSRRVLAVGVDAAEPALVRALISRGELPVLAGLLSEGTWRRVESPARIGSGAVWPTFLTGTEPAEHGIYGEWRWQPGTMSIARYQGRDLVPFWRDLSQTGATAVGVLDVPFAPKVGLSRGFEVLEWGAHDVLEGRVQASPNALSVIGEIGPHPFSAARPDADGPGDRAALAKLGAACRAGVRLRGELAARLLAATRSDLSVVVFPEVHTASHHLWHTVAPEPPLRDEFALAQILREVDRQVGRLVEAAGPETAVFVFSLHGMKSARGIPTLLDQVLHGSGYARRPGWGEQSWAGRVRSLFAAAKRRTPRGLKKLYYGTVSPSVTHRVAQTTMLPAYDWTRTRAFPLPTDQHGWIRLNLAGREAEGIVPPERYEETCRRLIDLLRALTTEDGRPVVREVIRPSRETGGVPPRQLPDLIVHWHDAASDSPARLRGYPSPSHPAGTKFTGQHAPDGFCIAKGEVGGREEDAPVAAADLHRLLIGALDPTQRNTGQSG